MPKRIELCPVTYEPGHPWHDFSVPAAAYPRLYDKALAEGLNHEESCFFTELSRSVLVYNDNVTAMVSADTKPGGGNAVIRPLAHFTPEHTGGRPLAVGIPTGDNGRGFQRLDAAAKHAIDYGLGRLEALVDQGARRIVYSCEDDGRTLGTGIFKVSPDVKEYIVSKIEHIAAKRVGRSAPEPLKLRKNLGWLE